MGKTLQKVQRTTQKYVSTERKREAILDKVDNTKRTVLQRYKKTGIQAKTLGKDAAKAIGSTRSSLLASSMGYREPMKKLPRTYKPKKRRSKKRRR